MNRVLQVIDQAYRCTVEEQDDPILWISAAMHTAGAALDVLLVANAVCYAVRGQDASGLRLGAWEQSRPPRLDEDVRALIARGITVAVIEEDVAERGLERHDLVAGIEPIARAALARLLSRYDAVWWW